MMRRLSIYIYVNNYAFYCLLLKGTYELLNNKNHIVLGDNLSNVTEFALINDRDNQIVKKTKD